MPWYKRLRWRLIATQFLVVAVGVLIMAVATWLILNAAPAFIRPFLLDLAQNPLLIEATETNILGTFRNAILLSVLIAATLALTAGVFSAITLWRVIINPLQQISHSSQRIANGRYNERVEVPTNSGEAMAQLIINFNQMASTLAHTEQQRVALLSNVSHELRTPLTGLRGYLEGLSDGLFPANEETFTWMSQEVERLQRLVNDIQNLARVEAGQFTLNLQMFEVTAVIQRIITELQSEARSKALSLTLQTPTQPIHVYADIDRTIQVLINLISNAIRYTPTQGQITLSVHTQAHHAAISVQDTGIGIPAKALPYIFERFYRVDPSRARNSGGTGIGLTITQHLLWAMGGDVTAISEGANKGTIFTFTLPLAPH